MGVRITEKDWGRIFEDEETGAQIAVIIKNRYEYIQDEDFSLSPDTLVGSHFQVFLDGDMIWRGAVVAEPRAGDYLVQLVELEDGARNVQRIFSLDTFMGLGEEGRRLIEHAMAQTSAPVVDPNLEWRFFDSKDNADIAHSAWAARRVGLDKGRT